jgi:hypothetical protein
MLNEGYAAVTVQFADQSSFQPSRWNRHRDGVLAGMPIDAANKRIEKPDHGKWRGDLVRARRRPRLCRTDIDQPQKRPEAEV